MSVRTWRNGNPQTLLTAYKSVQLLWKVVWHSLSHKVAGVRSLQPSISTFESLLWNSLAHVRKMVYTRMLLICTKLETTKEFIMMKTHEYTVLLVYDRVLLSNENKRTRSMCTDIDKSQNHVRMKATCRRLCTVYRWYELYERAKQFCVSFLDLLMWSSNNTVSSVKEGRKRKE